MRKSIQFLLVILLGIASLLYFQWRAPQSDFRETQPITNADSDPTTGDSVSVESPVFSEPERQSPDVDGPELVKLARSDDPFPHDLPMDMYWDVVTSEIREAPPKPKRIGEAIADGDEAYRLYIYYRWCATTLRTVEGADKQLKRLVDRTVGASAEKLEQRGEVAEFMLDRYEMCAPIPPEVDCQLEAFLWLTEAVMMGHEIAQTRYYSSALETLLYHRRYAVSTYLVLSHPELIEEFKVTARFALTEAMENGHPEAYLAMSRAVLDGVVFPRDPVMAFAYARAAELKVQQDVFYADWIEKQKRAVAQHLDAEQLLTAEKAALELFRNEDG